MKKEIRELIQASKDLMNNYHSEYLTANEEKTLNKMKIAIDNVEQVNEAETSDDKCTLHGVSNNEAVICPNCQKYKRLQGNGIIHQLCECDSEEQRY